MAPKLAPMPRQPLPAHPDLEEALPIAEQFAASRGLRVSVPVYRDFERIQIAWREAGLRKSLGLHYRYPDRGLTVKVLARGWAIPWRHFASWLGWLSVLAIVAWLAGLRYAAYAASLSFIVMWALHWSPPRGPEAPIYEFTVGVILTPVEAARDALLGLLERGWTMLREFGPEDLRREDHAALERVDSGLLPLLRQAAAEWGGSVQRTPGGQGPEGVWMLRWSGPRGPASLYVTTLPNHGMGVTALADASRRARAVGSWLVDWGDLEGLRKALAQARQAADSGPVGDAK
jgi:hypothetical protein